MTPAKRMQNRLERLQEHLERENPILVSVVGRYRKLDQVAQKMGLLEANESYATQISWWPLISILGTFSAGKSSFINSYLRLPLQNTGNQAVDDRFTVATFSSDAEIRTLPGIALDGDPRFPFYQISEDIENVARGEGAKIDNYLQMKAAPSEKLRGKILIDSPGFDADEQRKATLRLTDHIIDLSDLVLVFFDARHPEPGAMQDTLEHLVRGALRRNDNAKFLFILNQIDTSAKEDNMEEVVAAWQKALVQSGLNAGKFYVIFNKELATPVADQSIWKRYVSKRDEDYEKITRRMDEINIERIYRIIGSLESLTNQIEQQAVPKLQLALQRWKKSVLLTDAAIMIPVLLGLFVFSIFAGYWEGLSFNPPWLASIQQNLVALGLLAGLIVVFLGALHFFVRNRHAKRIARKLDQEESYGNLSGAFLKNTRWWKTILRRNPTGWGNRVAARLDRIRSDIDLFVQTLNDRYTRPSGDH